MNREIRLLENKNAIITGCSRGIGKSTLEIFAQNGANIWACCRKKNDEFEEHIEVLSNKYGVKIIGIYFDLADNEQIKKGMKEILNSGENIDILVNNAGMVAENALFQMTTIENMKRVFEINFFAPMLIIQYALKKMSRQKFGSIVNIASVAGIDGEPGQVEYVSSKAAIIGATKKLASELSYLNIRVNAVAPGITETDMIANMSENKMKETLKSLMMKRAGEPSEIARVVMFLASEMSSYMTGQVIRVDGGKL